MERTPQPAIIPSSEKPLKSLKDKIKKAEADVMAAEYKTLPHF